MTARGTATWLKGAHSYAHDTITQRCGTCGFPDRNELHALRPSSPEARAYDAAVLGEPPDDDEEPW